MEPIRSFYDQNGYVVVPGLFSADEVAFYRDHYMAMRARGSYPGDMAGVDLTSDDPLKKFPRLIHMHRWDESSLRWMLDPRIERVLTLLLGSEPLAVQTMLYFKPPKARGQALHQDNFYLRAQPGTCMAAWLALDPCDESNGCMQVVPGSHTWPILCTQPADTTASFTDVTVPIPKGEEVCAVPMRPGDVLFFHGSLVHGSFPNRTTDRFRRSLIGHYITVDAEQLTEYDQPALRMDGTELRLKPSTGGGPCGVWGNRDGVPEITLRTSSVEAIPVE